MPFANPVAEWSMKAVSSVFFVRAGLIRYT